MSDSTSLSTLNTDGHPAIDSVFVYGTLKPGLRYHHVAQRGGAFNQTEASVEGFELYHFHEENYPAIIPGEGRVYGWRYTYQDIARALPFLDELEGCHLHPPEYQRIRAVSQPDTVPVWLYIYYHRERLHSAAAIKLPTGHWEPRTYRPKEPLSLINKGE